MHYPKRAFLHVLFRRVDLVENYCFCKVSSQHHQRLSWRSTARPAHAGKKHQHVGKAEEQSITRLGSSEGSAGLVYLTALEGLQLHNEHQNLILEL